MVENSLLEKRDVHKYIRVNIASDAVVDKPLMDFVFISSSGFGKFWMCWCCEGLVKKCLMI